MRIISGKYRGTPLQAPPGKTTRPLTDRVKESLFNILIHRQDPPGSLGSIDVLDMFAGSGSLGLEALSRGARSCLFVERDRHSLPVLRDNLQKLRVEQDTQVVSENAWTMRIPPAPAGDGYGLVFVDPPYRDVRDPQRSLDLLERLVFPLAPDGVLVFRYELGTDFPIDQVAALTCADDRTMGTMRLLLFEHTRPT